MTPQEINAKADELAMEACHKAIAFGYCSPPAYNYQEGAKAIRDTLHLPQLLACVEALRHMQRAASEKNCGLKCCDDSLAAYDEAVKKAEK